MADAAALDHGFDFHLFHVRVQRSHVDLVAGRWDAAERRLREQLDTARDPAAVLRIPMACSGGVGAGEAARAVLRYRPVRPAPPVPAH